MTAVPPPYCLGPGPFDPNSIIYEDNFLVAPAPPPAPMPIAAAKPARRPLCSTVSNNDVVLDPPYAPHLNYSPNKINSSSPRSPLGPSCGKLNAVSMAPPNSRPSTTDSLQKRPPLSKFKTGSAQRSISSPSIPFGKENVFPQAAFSGQSPMDFSPLGEWYPRPTSKGALMDAAPITEVRLSKKPKPDCGASSKASANASVSNTATAPTVADAAAAAAAAAVAAANGTTHLPPHDSFPPTQDDGTKPQHSYAQLIGMAILRSPHRRLTLAQIYKWISDNYSFYGPNDAGWQNSIRHNLSLHKNFLKVERPKDDPGKGNYWTIEPGTELQFLKEKPVRKSATTAENIPVMSTRLEPSRPAMANTPLLEHSLPATAPAGPGPASASASAPVPPGPPSASAPLSATAPTAPAGCGLPPLPASQQAVAASQAVPELSSDATILVSDAGPQDDAANDQDLPPDSSIFSPLPANMHSSPPGPRHAEMRSGTPPSAAGNNHPSSATRPAKRRFVDDDGGYMSALDSSVMRPNNPKALLLTSEGDHPPMKRGSAEEEIVRLRGSSSPFSPTNPRPVPGCGFVSSSPLRQPNDGQMLPPLTPMVKMKAPARPPPSASPNTTLRLHRAKVHSMLQSPLRRIIGAGGDDLSWSPAAALNMEGSQLFLDEEFFIFDDAAAKGSMPLEFDIFQDLPTLTPDDHALAQVHMNAASPTKPPSKRVKFDRTPQAPLAPTETTNSARNMATATLAASGGTPPFKLFEPASLPTMLGGPVRAIDAGPPGHAMGSSPRLFSGVPIGQQTAHFGADRPRDDVTWSMPSLDNINFMAHAPAPTVTQAANFCGLDMLQEFGRIGSTPLLSAEQHKTAKMTKASKLANKRP